MKAPATFTMFKPTTSRTMSLFTFVFGLSIALCLSQASANEFSNGKLDMISISSQNLATPTGWTVEAYRNQDGPHPDGASSEMFCNVQDPGGYGLFFKPFQGMVDLHNEINVLFYQDNAASPGGKYTMSAYTAGQVNYSGFFATNDPAPSTLFVVQFLDGLGTVLQSNVVDLVANGLPNGGPGAMILMSTPQYTAPLGTVTVRAGASMFNTYATSGQQSVFFDVFDLEFEPPLGSPMITNQPAHTTVSPGETANLTVGVSNPAGVTYQWQKLIGVAYSDLSDGGNVSGALTSTLTISGVSSADVGHYRVRCTNGSGTSTSEDATLQIVDINFYPVISIDGKIGDVNIVEYSTALAPTIWMPLTTNTLSMSPELIIDSSSPGSNTRFYRATYQPPAP